MIDLPDGVPMWTNDIQQEAVRLGIALPEQAQGQHNALADARHLVDCWRALAGATADSA
jgi:hypothetical protein